MKTIDKPEQNPEATSSAHSSSPRTSSTAGGGAPGHPVTQQAAGNLAIQRLLQRHSIQSKPLIQRQVDSTPTNTAASATSAASQTSATAAVPATDRPEGMIVDDTVQEPAAHQMKRGQFLSQLRTAVISAAEQTLAASPFAAMMRPQVNEETDKQFRFYSSLDSHGLENTIRRQAPGAAGATAASGLIPPVGELVRQNVAANLPKEEGVTGVAGAAVSAIGSMAESIGSTVSSIGSILFKTREGGTRKADDPRGIRAQLGAGHGLDSRVQAGMASALGHDFGNVRVHTGAGAARLADQFNARAFTIGRDIGFAAGEYQPGTPIGDALIAHELAHVAQQSAASYSEPLHKGESGDTGLEEDADRSAASVVVSMWGEVRAGLIDTAQSAMPRLRSGLRLQKCTREPTPAPTEVFNHPNNTSPISAPGEQILFTSVFTSGRPSEFQTIYTCVGGHFDTPASGPLRKISPGHGMANLPFFIDQAWDGATPVQVEMQILRLSDGATVAKKSWNFGKKPYYPTTITQLEGDEERSLGPGGSLQYTYIVGPAVGPDGIRRTYQNHTILERFEGVTCNIARTELKPEFQAAHPELMNSEQIARFFFDPASLNASFTLDVNGAMADLNGENHVSRAFPGLMAALTTMKEVHFDNAQVFEAQPGVPLGRYIIRRIVKPNGALAMRKFRA